MNYLQQLLSSWAAGGDEDELRDIIDWYAYFNDNLKVNISETSYASSTEWEYDSERDAILRKNGGFFTITGLTSIVDNISQPVILQDEIGYLGILMQKQNGVLKCLMQAKIEPGNINKIQISPTIQATKSNFLQAHGGKRPNYLEYFLNAKKENILFDQIQSEQSSRFFGKRNRNTIVILPEDEHVKVLPRFRWMTIGQVKKLMRLNNIVNMDTRTVLSAIPSAFLSIERSNAGAYKKYFKNEAVFNSLFAPIRLSRFKDLYRDINDYKMLEQPDRNIVGLSKLSDWHWDGDVFRSDVNTNFEVIFCDIEIEDREVSHWQQPLFKAVNEALFVLAFRRDSNNTIEFLIKPKIEAGCFDTVEFGPTWQAEGNERQHPKNSLERLLLNRISDKDRISYNVKLSEEGGRFYQEQNDNVILELNQDEQKLIDEDCYVWLSLRELAVANVFNNVLNIQLRNLLSLIEIGD